MHFIKYPHLETFGNDEVDNINAGECWIFPKLDGANAQVWWKDYRARGKADLAFGSRNLDLGGFGGNDNQGFMEFFKDDQIYLRYKSFFAQYPDHRLYGEWLVPHAFKGYRDDAWRRFWIFDVTRKNEEDTGEHFITYDTYSRRLEEFGLDYVLPINKVTNPGYEVLVKFLDKATFLCKDGVGPGEGIVIKNYGFYNKFGRQTWAKLVRQEFKEKHTKHHGVSELDIGDVVEAKIVDKYVSQFLVDKEFAKIKVEGWSSKMIPRLLDTVFYCLCTEELWTAIKEYRNPKIDFKTLKALTIQRIKQLKPEVF